MMEKKKALLSGLLLVLVLTAAAVMVSRLAGGTRPPGVSSNAYYYDLNTGELFVDKAGLIPPIDAPSGPLKGTADTKAGVRAYVFTCGEDSESDRFIAWIETYTPETQKILIDSNEIKTSHPLVGQGGAVASPLVALTNTNTPDKVNWMPSQSLMGIKIVRGSTAPCPNGSFSKPCVPE